jgi:hypothetical protein
MTPMTPIDADAAADQFGLPTREGETKILLCKKA